jgi:hypothetical protein
LSLWGVVYLFLLFYGRVELACIRGHARTSTKPHKLGDYYCGGVSYLSCAWGSCISCSLLWSDNMELHHLTPLGILHMVAFLTLCEAYIGMEPHFNLWNYFFRA